MKGKNALIETKFGTAVDLVLTWYATDRFQITIFS